MNSATKKIHHGRVRWGVYIALAALFFWACTNPAISDPIINFLFGGVVPGANMTVSPDIMIYGSLGAAALAIILFAGLHIRSRNKRLVLMLLAQDPSFAVPKSVSKISTLPVDTPISIRLAPQGGEPAMAKRQRRMPNVFGKLRGAQLDARLFLLLEHIVRVLSRIMRALRTASLQLGGIMLLSIIKFAAVVALAGGYTWTYLQAFSVQAWRWLQPHLMAFDSWLELRYRALDRRLESFLERFETVHIAKTLARDGRENLRQLFKH